MNIREWAPPRDTTAVQQLASRLWPRGPHPGGLGWEAAIDQLPPARALAETDVVVGWVGLEADEVRIHVDPAAPEAGRALLAWVGDAAHGRPLPLTVFDGDDALRSLVLGAGYEPDSKANPVVGMFHPARTSPVAIPDGFRVRGVRDDEYDARVEVHRQAWRPATLPWPPGAPAVAADATSRFTPAHFEEVRRTWLYDQTLDLVVQAPDGSLAACCTVWWDPATGCSEIEPLGVVPEHRRKGLAGVLCAEAARRTAERGGTDVFINTGPRADYPAPAQTYLAHGFVARRRAVTYRPRTR